MTRGVRDDDSGRDSKDRLGDGLTVDGILLTSRVGHGGTVVTFQRISQASRQGHVLQRVGVITWIKSSGWHESHDSGREGVETPENKRRCQESLRCLSRFAGGLSEASGRRIVQNLWQKFQLPMAQAGVGHARPRHDQGRGLGLGRWWRFQERKE